MIKPSFIDRLAKARVIAEQLLVFAVGVLFLAVDLFGVSEVTARHSLRTWNVLVDSWDQVTGATDATRFQNRGVVVLMTDHDLEEYGEAFPPRAWFHAEVVKRLIEARPAAIFLDFVFSRSTENRDDPTFAKLWSALAHASTSEPRVPIIVAALSSSTERHTPLHRELEALIRAGHVRPAHIERLELDSYLQRYRLVGSSPDALKGAAFELYVEFCATWPQDCLDSHPDMFQSEMSVFWSSRSPTERMPVFGECAARRGPFYDALAHTRAIMLGASLNLRCPYTLTVSADDVRVGSIERLRDLVEGRIILYGGHVSVAPDVALTPLHGLLPGVFTHAMALDNLMAWGPRYYRASIRGFEWIQEFAIIEMSALAVVLFLPLLVNRIRRAKPRKVASTLSGHHEIEPPRAFITSAVITLLRVSVPVLLHLGLLALIIWLEIVVLHMAPLNWLGLIGIILLGELCKSPVSALSAVILLLRFPRFRRRLRRGLINGKDAEITRKMVRFVKLSSPPVHQVVAVRVLQA